MKYYLILCFFLLQAQNSDAQKRALQKAKAGTGMQGAPASSMVDYPPRIDPFLKILGADHPGLGAYIVGLGDVNGDGYGDFAVSSTLDTTFIFFGGPNLDDRADLFVLGGGAGIVAGDINGDGYTDLVTSQKDYPPKLDPDRKGLVRIYLHNHTATAYNAQPNLQMAGRNQYAGFGFGGATHFLGGDINGDGKLDLLVEGYNDKTPNGKGILYLYLGSAIPDTIPDFQFMDTHGGEPRGNFGEKFAVTDLNHDGYDDIIIQGMGKHDTNEEIHLGNPGAQYGAPYEDVKYQDPFNFSIFPWDILDVDGNDCSEIFPLVRQQYPPFGWGKCGQDFPKQVFQPDTVFPNPYPAVFDEGFYVAPIGRFNGSVYKNYIIEWGIQGVDDGVSCWMYQSGPGWQTAAVGYYGLRVIADGVGGEPFPIGDVTGDNIDDFALLGDPQGLFFHQIWIFKGDRQYKLTGLQAQSNRLSPAFNLYPNPVTSFDTRRVYLQGNLASPSTLDITVYDLLGRSVLRTNRIFEAAGPFQIPIEIHALKPGGYFVSIDDGEKRYIRSMMILSH